MRLVEKGKAFGWAALLVAVFIVTQVLGPLSKYLYGTASLVLGDFPLLDFFYMIVLDGSVGASNVSIGVFIWIVAAMALPGLILNCFELDRTGERADVTALCAPIMYLEFLATMAARTLIWATVGLEDSTYLIIAPVFSLLIQAPVAALIYAKVPKDARSFSGETFIDEAEGAAWRACSMAAKGELTEADALSGLSLCAADVHACARRLLIYPACMVLDVLISAAGLVAYVWREGSDLYTIDLVFICLSALLAVVCVVVATLQVASILRTDKAVDSVLRGSGSVARSRRGRAAERSGVITFGGVSRSKLSKKGPKGLAPLLIAAALLALGIGAFAVARPTGTGVSGIQDICDDPSLLLSSYDDAEEARERGVTTEYLGWFVIEGEGHGHKGDVALVFKSDQEKDKQGSFSTWPRYSVVVPYEFKHVYVYNTGTKMAGVANRDYEYKITYSGTELLELWETSNIVGAVEHGEQPQWLLDATVNDPGAASMRLDEDETIEQYATVAININGTEYSLASNPLTFVTYMVSDRNIAENLF